MVSRGAHRYVSGEGREGGALPKGGGGGGEKKKKKKIGKAGGGGGRPKKKKKYIYIYIYIVFVFNFIFIFFWGGAPPPLPPSPPPPLPFSERNSHVLAPGVILLNAERFIDSRNRTQDVWILCTSTRCTLLLFNIEEAIV